MKHFLAALLFIVCTFSISSQSINYNYGQEDMVRLEVNKLLLTDVFELRTLDAYLNGEFTVGGKNKIAFEIPFSRYAFDFGSVTSVSSNFGNMAIAYQIRNLNDPNYFEIKLRLPTAEEGSLFPFGLLADYTERYTSIIPDLISLEGSYNIESKNSLGMYGRFRPGLKVLIPTDDGFIGDDFEMLLDLNFLGGYRGGNFDVNAGLTSFVIISEDDIDFDDRVLRQLFASFTYTGGAFKPGLIFRLPLGDITEFINFVVGVHGTYTFGGKTKMTPVEASDN